MTVKARDLMTSPALTVTEETPIREVASIMLHNRVSGLPVVDQKGNLLGIVTELHLVARNAPVTSPNYISVLSGLIPLSLTQYQHYREHLRQVLATTAGELMDGDVEFIAPDTDLDTIIGVMERPEIVQLPVVEGTKVIGVVSRTDVVRLIEELEMAPASPEMSDE